VSLPERKKQRLKDLEKKLDSRKNNNGEKKRERLVFQGKVKKGAIAVAYNRLGGGRKTSSKFRGHFQPGAVGKNVEGGRQKN